MTVLRKIRHTIETKIHRIRSLCYCLPKSYFLKNGLNANFYISNMFYIFQTTKEYTYIVCDNFSKLAITFSQIKKKVCLNILFLQSEFTFLSTKCKYYSCFYCLLVRKSPTCQRDLPCISKVFTLASSKLAERKLGKFALLMRFSISPV